MISSTWTSWRFQTSQKRQREAMVTEFQGVWVASSLRLILASRSKVGWWPIRVLDRDLSPFLSHTPRPDPDLAKPRS